MPGAFSRRAFEFRSPPGARETQSIQSRRTGSARRPFSGTAGLLLGRRIHHQCRVRPFFFFGKYEGVTVEPRYAVGSHGMVLRGHRHVSVDWSLNICSTCPDGERTRHPPMGNVARRLSRQSGSISAPPTIGPGWRTSVRTTLNACESPMFLSRRFAVRGSPLTRVVPSVVTWDRHWIVTSQSAPSLHWEHYTSQERLLSFNVSVL